MHIVQIAVIEIAATAVSSLLVDSQPYLMCTFYPAVLSDAGHVGAGPWV